jgi:Uma2 family endonuclease
MAVRAILGEEERIVEALRDIVVPETQPATEWVLGGPVQKVSPKRRHAILQVALSTALMAWARGRGQVGSEWRFGITPPGERTRPLVPDIAYLSFERMRGLTPAELDTPKLSPDIVIEIRSPDDRAAHLEHKRDVYLAAGVRLLLIIDPETRTLEAFEPNAPQRVLTAGETYETPSFPGLRIDLPAVFAELDLP